MLLVRPRKESEVSVWWLGMEVVSRKLLFVRSSLLIFVAESSSEGEWHRSRLAQ